ncbi:MAG: SDR family oxidoreductase [Candidatus Dormibacteraeota bacterium]|nr:SDR family oxidoreductase [Candidatus Dormibacteraeota bacterium]MBV9526163.1 SDR family oxidoreductase [Candidatus Dormibacteraeota bacterium]
MIDERPLDGRVAIVTGSSRGIGRAMALRLAREGASVVVTGKSEEGTERLPGSIHTVRQEIEDGGGTAIAVRVDVRRDEEVEAMVNATIERFGRLDILVNNAGAMWWQPVLQTPPKRYDLMWQINVRAAYLCAYYALPHMIDRHWGHIINCSPPIGTEANPGYVAYMTTKMGMTRMAIGIASEYEREGIASNSLWPVTIIESLASINWGLSDRSQWRSPEILCDAMMEILRTEPPSLTGQQLLDEPFLRERGWTQEQLDSYWLEGKPPDHPTYIDGRAGASM